MRNTKLPYRNVSNGSLTRYSNMEQVRQPTVHLSYSSSLNDVEYDRSTVRFQNEQVIKHKLISCSSTDRYPSHSTNVVEWNGSLQTLIPVLLLRGTHPTRQN